MIFPSISPRTGLAPEWPRVEPVHAVQDDGAVTALSWPLRVEGEVLLDFGRLLAGRVWIDTDGPIEYLYAADRVQLQRLLDTPPGQRLRFGVHETYARAKPWGTAGSAGGAPTPLADEVSVLRLLLLRASEPVTVRCCYLDFSAPHKPLAGRFACSDSELERIWHMGVYTTLLCTQDNRDALVPVPAPGSGYVIWDGVRRDREVWAGDLRLASLIWLSAYDDPEPVANSLYLLWQGRHVGCSHSGMVPGSGSSHQIFYEWTFWFLVNAWEYYWWTGDRHFLEVLAGTAGLELTLGWIKSELNASGLIPATNSWMYTLKIQGETSSLAVVQAAGLDALAKLFDAAGRAERAAESRALAQQTRDVILGKFYDPEKRALRLYPLNDAGRARFPLDANALAPLCGVGDAAMREGCLAFLRSPELMVDAGRRCICPPYGDSDGDWFHFGETSWVHNDTVWPFPNCYAAWALLRAGQIDAGLDALKAFHRPLIRQGHCTVWEAIMPDGMNTVAAHGNLMSLCHAWGGAGSYLLQAEVLGVRPEAPGFGQVRLQPGLGSLDWAKGCVPTRNGLISVELERTSKGIEGRLSVPKEVEVVQTPVHVEIEVR